MLRSKKKPKRGKARKKKKKKRQIPFDFSKIRPALPAIAFGLGFLLDVFTLKRIDNTLDMIILSVYLCAAGTALILISRKAEFRWSQHLPWAIQFLFGGLFSACVVYYFKSASTIPMFFFVCLLFGILVANEFVEKLFWKLTVPFVFFGFCCLMVFNFVIPVLLRAMGPWVFLLSAAGAFGISFMVQRLMRTLVVPFYPLITLYCVIVAAYFLNIIPPVPLAQKHLAIYRSVRKEGGNYVCAMQKRGFLWRIRKGERTFRHTEGDTVFCFSSVFAPIQMRTALFHQWFWYNKDKGRYLMTDQIGYPITGGRDNGYRGYTFKQHVREGKWKIKLITENGKTVGKIKFKVVKDTAKPKKSPLREFLL